MLAKNSNSPMRARLRSSYEDTLALVALYISILSCSPRLRLQHERVLDSQTLSHDFSPNDEMLLGCRVCVRPRLNREIVEVRSHLMIENEMITKNPTADSRCNCRISLVFMRAWALGYSIG